MAPLARVVNPPPEVGPFVDLLASGTGYQKIELVWPGKDLNLTPVQDDAGVWHLQSVPDYRSACPLNSVSQVGAPAEPNLIVFGDRLSALETLERSMHRFVAFAYLDVPRTVVDDKATAFQGDDIYVYSAWMSVMRTYLHSVERTMMRSGAVAIHVGDLEMPYARLVADEVFGRGAHVGSIVWQRAYAPRNMKGMKEFTATHDAILLYAIDKSFIEPVGLRTVPSGFSNEDGDPREEWRAMHKGAHSRREKSDFNAYVPPYRYELAQGRLPVGLWRVNPLTGVIWGTPLEEGTSDFTVRVTDADGNVAERSFSVTVTATGTVNFPREIPWLFQEHEASGDLRITTESLPDAIVGVEYSAICLADGGTPFKDTPKRPGSGRYWEFADDTLLKAYLRDQVWLGKKNDAIPSIKTYLRDVGEEEIKNQQTWWPGRGKKDAVAAGYTQDATKHLKKLREIGAIKEVTGTAKPEPLIERLIEIFTREGDFVLEPFGVAAQLAAVGLKKRRNFIWLGGSSARDRALAEQCGVERLRAVVDGRDNKLEEIEGEIDVKEGTYIPFAGGGGYRVVEVGEWLARRATDDEFPLLNREAYKTVEEMTVAVLGSEGYLPSQDDFADGRSLSGDIAVVVPADEYLTTFRASEITSRILDAGMKGTVFYFMASDDFDSSVGSESVVFRRVPSELRV